MTTTTTLTLSDLIEDTLGQLYRETERPAQVSLNSGINASVTELTLSDATGVDATSILEIDSELLLVSAKSADATPVLTVSRGYAGSTAAAHDSGDVVRINPYWSRLRVTQAIQSAFKGPLNTYLPYIASESLTPEADKRFIELPAGCLEVLEVRYLNTTSYDLLPIGGWREEQNVPTAISSTGKLLRVPSQFTEDDSLVVTYRATYSWTGSGEAATVPIPLGAEDLPALYCAARLAVGRELSRSELDKVEEWNNEQATRSGFSTGLIRLLWQDFYRRLDEARKLHHVPKHRPYRKMRRHI